MKNKLKAIMVLSLALIMAITTSAAAAQKPITVNVYFAPMHYTFDGKEYAPAKDQRGFIYEGSTYVPLRFIAYSLDKSVKWDGKSYTVTISKPTASELISINEFKLNAQVRNQAAGSGDKVKLKPTDLKVYKEKVTYIFDGKGIQPSEKLPGFIIDGSLYVPIRFVSEALGKKIDWDPATYTIAASVRTQEKDPVDGSGKKPEDTSGSGKPSGGTDGKNEGNGNAGNPGAPGTPGGSGGSTKPSEESIKSAAQSKLQALQSSCTSELSSLADKFFKTGDTDLLAQGSAKLSACDSQFSTIVGEAESQLSANGYSTSIIQTYKNTYEQVKNAALADLQKRQ
ncbi:copper amine oxidase N-terminal domain-containing protein [Paenibacillus eucommiae]|uniref:Copper amine oxidase-like N-terminal domain-containing protein n=1 Tax=Paenibacillus eucommiae TaxID=1355755 RepID=A0ABS4J0S3_9BACL|nr:copper amine oxidase N-terminal domain-containing protein [Paenibacillus eucommiae]MBP1993426.1 hypothetical protein [Paenibacillus eucommiae]